MKVIIAGSREIHDYSFVHDAMEMFKLHLPEPTEILSGCARGVDQLAIEWADLYDIPIKEYPADWGKHGKSAGFIRNRQMAENADALVAIWDGVSRGTKHMIDTAKEKGLICKVYKPTVVEMKEDLNGVWANVANK